MENLFYRMDVLFWFRKSESQPPVPPYLSRSDVFGSISCRITINGERCEVGSTKAACWKSEWGTDSEKIKRKDKDYGREMLDNARINDMRSALHSVHMLLVSMTKAEGGPVSDITCYDVKRNFQEKQNGYSIKAGVRVREVLSAWIDYELRRLFGKEISQASYDIRSNYVGNIKDFLQSTRRDVQAKDFDGGWMDELRIYLTGAKGFKITHAAKHLQAMKQAFIWARRRKLIRDNTISDYIITGKDVRPDTTHLEEDHLRILFHFDPYKLIAEGKLTPMLAKIMDQERDALLFTCVTGMHDGDYKRQEYKLIEDEYGVWVFGKRQKTGEKFRVPLDPIGLSILKKYGGIGNLPKRPNQKRNGYLKMLSVLTGIPVHLTTKIGRKTFANRTLNELDFDPIDVASMLGQRDLKSLKHYARVQPQRLAKKFKPLNLDDNEEAA
ncbi:site-specific integrase [Larkinella ripae]